VTMRVVFSMILISATLILTSCETPQQRVESQENLLSAAGFVQYPATTPQRQASLQRLPRENLVRTVHGDKVVYVLADPLVCNCLYIGDQQAWGNYQRERLQLQIADEEATEASNSEAGAWGP
jgi:hypothetical protein